MERNKEKDTTESHNEQQKKSPFDQLNKDELVIKCNKLLILAQKAKQARDAAVGENKTILGKLSQFETQKEADKTAIMSMQEMLDALTEDKFSLTSQIAEYQNNNEKLQKTVQEFENQESTRNSEICIENESLKRQLKRMTDENEDLINDLDNMETKFKQVTAQIDLEQLDEQTNKWKDLEEKMQQLTEQNTYLQNELSKFEAEEIVNKNLHDEWEAKLNKQVEKFNLQCTEIKNMKVIEEKHIQKIQFLKFKLLEILGKLKKMKNCKSVLLQTQAEYAEAVGKWQMDITNASVQLMTYIKVLEKKLKNYENEKYQIINDEQPICQNTHETKFQIILQCCDNAIQEFNEKSAEAANLLNDLEKFRCINEELAEENTHLKQQMYNCNDRDGEKTDTEKLSISYNDARKNFNILTEHFNKKSTELEQLKTEFSRLFDNNSNLKKSLKDSVQDKKEVKLKCTNLSENLEKLQEKYEKQTEQLKNYVVSEKSFQQELNDLKECIKNSDRDKLKIESIIDEKHKIIERMKFENSDLLSEMRELNEALKGRGDVISRQQDKITELEIELKKIVSNSMKTETKDKPNDQQQSQLVDLTEPPTGTDSQLIASPRSNKIQDAQSEILSVSSISRVDSTIRLREVDESFEEKYIKVRSIALKLKKKVQEQAAQIANLEKTHEDQRDGGGHQLPASQSGANHMKNIQALHIEMDRCMDEIESLKQTVKMKEKECKESHDMINTLNQNLAKIDEELKLAEKLKLAKDNQIIDFQAQIKSFKQEKDTFNLIRKELEKERDSERKTAEERDTEKTRINEQLEKAKKELDKLKAVGKQSNVLNLEIQAYEKSLNEASNKMDNLKIQVKELTESIQSKDDTISSLKKEIHLLENQIESEKSHSQELKQQIDIQQQKLKQIEYDKVEMNSQIQDFKTDNQTKLEELEKLHAQSDETASVREKLYVSLQTEKENLHRQLVQTEQSLQTISANLKTTENDLNVTRTEYTSYKVRAQSILRQNQSKESSRERELEEELNTIQADHDALNIKMKKSLEIKETLEKKVHELRQENECVQKRCNELIELLDELQTQNDLTVDENRNQIIQYQETIKTNRLQIDTLNKCYKQQLDDMEAKHLKELNDLKKCRRNSDSGGGAAAAAAAVPSDMVKSISRIGPFGGASTSSGIGFKTNDENKIDLILMEREDAEGSEASYTMPLRKISSTRSKHDLIPLDELLNSSLDENPREYIEERTISPNHELQMTRDKVNAQHSQIRHLTALLSESEQDLVKFTQLNDVLKEELRRHERTLEREKHMHNSEYLKNVVLKFLTLNNADERTRLVPVLNTILKLSPNETNILQNVAKGIDVQGSSRGWGSYLSTWTSHS